MSVAILVPVLNRPHRIAPLMANVHATTKRYRLLFIANEGDDEEISALEACRADYIVVPANRVSWACKINDGFRATTQSWVFTGADDLKFHPQWWERTFPWITPETRVIGTNDICNPSVMSGAHSTHTLFRRDYVERFGTIDQPGIVMHEGYRHDWVDNEAIATAKARGVYVHAFDSIVEHLHPLNGKAPEDDTYKRGRQFSSEGRRLFQKRKVLWSDEAMVKLAMVPPPERAVVVTATYGGYDAELHVPVAQDIPCEFVCLTDEKFEAPAPWKVIVRKGEFGKDGRMNAKVAKMLPDVGCDDVVWIDASHEITSPSFVREALAARHDGFAAFKHPRRNCVYAEIDALLGKENQNGLYFSRPLKEQAEAYRLEGHPERAGLFACGTLAWDLRDPRARELGQAWLDETAKWSHQDQCELPVVCRRLGITPGTFPIAQLDPKLSRGRRYLANRWFRIHPHTVKEEPKPVVKVSVLIPFASTGQHRLANLEFVRGKYEDSGWEVIVGACDGQWSKGRALADAFSRASHDVLVIADADCIADEASLDLAIRAVADSAAWAVPHRRTWRLNQQMTRRLLEGSVARPQSPQQAVVVGGGIVVCSRQAWLDSGGIDPRFLGWGGEDISFGWALETLCGPGVLGKGRLYHLWHPPHASRRGSPDSEELAGRYRRARGDVEAMRRLVDEVRALA